jgi:hypothetical protein
VVSISADERLRKYGKIRLLPKLSFAQRASGNRIKIQVKLDIKTLSREGRATAGSQIDDSARSSVNINYR